LKGRTYDAEGILAGCDAAKTHLEATGKGTGDTYEQLIDEFARWLVATI